MATKFARWRAELFFRDSEELKAQLLFLARHQHLLDGVNLTNKSRDDDLFLHARTIREQLPEIQICVHVSIKHQYRRDAEKTLTNISELLSHLSEIENCSILLISGPGKKNALDTISALHRLRIRNALAQRNVRPVHVAFNPYFPDSEKQKEENSRLSKKLHNDPASIAGIYLQMGTDISALRKGLDHIDKVVADVQALLLISGHSQTYKPSIYGSIFLPSRQLLAQMKFRPWNGVYLSAEYLSDVKTAEAITIEILAEYSKRGITPIVESAVKTQIQLDAVLRLMATAYSDGTHESAKS